MLKGKKEFNQFRKEVKEALQGIAEKYNFNIEAGGIKYDNLHMDLTLKISDKEVNGKSVEQLEFEKYCELFNLEKSDYLKTFTSSSSGKEFTLYGFNLRAKSMPILARDQQGNGYKFRESSVRNLLKVNN